MWCVWPQALTRWRRSLPIRQRPGTRSLRRRARRRHAAASGFSQEVELSSLHSASASASVGRAGLSRRPGFLPRGKGSQRNTLVRHFRGAIWILGELAPIGFESLPNPWRYLGPEATRCVHRDTQSGRRASTEFTAAQRTGLTRWSGAKKSTRCVPRTQT